MRQHFFSGDTQYFPPDKMHLITFGIFLIPRVTRRYPRYAWHPGFDQGFWLSTPPTIPLAARSRVYLCSVQSVARSR